MAFLRSVISGNLVMLLVGCNFGWTTIYLPQLKASDSPLHVTIDELSWIASLNIVGAIIGCIAVYILHQRTGRKYLLLYATVPYFTGWWLLFVSNSATMIIISEVVLSISFGIGLVMVPTYFSEISKTKHRGAVTATEHIAYSSGQIVINILGIFLSIRESAIAMASLSALTAFCLAWTVESPYYLVLHGKVKKAEECLIKLRGTTEVQEEMNEITKTVTNDLLMQTTDFFTLFTNPRNRKLVLLLCGQLMLIVFSGCYALPVYAGIVFTSLFGDAYGRYISFTIGLSELIGVILTASLVDVVGRKRIFITTMIATSLFTLTVAVYFYFEPNELETGPFAYVTACIIVLSTACLASMQSLTFVLAAEMYPTSIKTQGVVLEESLNVVYVIVVAKLFAVLEHAVGFSGPFLMFSAFCVVAAIYTAFLIPETARKSFDEILSMMQKK